MDPLLSEAELSELEDFLGSYLEHGDCMDISMLDGYLTAIAIGPVTLVPSEWYPPIWGGVDEPRFDSAEQAQRISELIVRYHNQIIGGFLGAPEAFVPYLYEYAHEKDGKWEVSAEEWCTGFSLGVHLRTESWEPLIKDKEFSELLAPIVAFSWETAWKQVTKRRDEARVRKELLDFLPFAIQGIYLYWHPERAERWIDAVTNNLPVRGRSGNSRNALCGCGSGKKYKKCCGAPGKKR